MFVLGGDAFPHDTKSLRAVLARGAARFGAADGAVIVDGEYPSVAKTMMNLTGVRLDTRKAFATAVENTGGGFFSRVLDIAAEPAFAASVPVRLRMCAEDCVFAFGTAADGTHVASLQSCTSGTLDASAATTDLEAALLGLARDAATKHGAEVESVRLTLEAENPRQIAVTAIAVAKAMFFTATLTIRGRVALDGEFNLRLSETACTGDGMIANLAAAQLRPKLAALELSVFSIQAFLPAGLQLSDVVLSGGASLKLHATIGAAMPADTAREMPGK
jgi:hypothetical protein